MDTSFFSVQKIDGRNKKYNLPKAEIGFRYNPLKRGSIMFRISVLLFIFLPILGTSATIRPKGSEFFLERVSQVLKMLPGDFLDFENGNLIIEELSLTTDKYFEKEDLCSIHPDAKFGLTKKNKILISSKLVDLARRNQKIFNCGHKTFFQMLNAVIIHELTHVKDNQERISLDPNFQRIVGVSRVTRNSKQRLINQPTTTTPDAYEFKNLEESLAVNTEYLLLDPEFKCRRPATAQFLAKMMNLSIDGNCSKNYNVLAQSAYLEDNYQLSVSINPDRIYQIHYLFAGQGRQLMSRWGHAMFRLVVCAPHRVSPGPECLEDVSHHLALSYRAHMTDFNISYTKGITGKYPSQLFVLRYLEVQQEYTKFELRDLFSIPLKLSKLQKKEFIDLTLERFWSYQGRYYFLNNNCGTEAVKHLSVALTPEASDLIGSITPEKIYRDITDKRHDLSDGYIQGLSRDEMINSKLLVPSMYDEYNSIYLSLKLYLKSFKYSSLEKFLKKTSALERLQDYEQIIHNSLELSLNDQRQLIIKLIHFERYLAARYLQLIPKLIMKRIDRDNELKTQVSNMGESLKLMGLQPWQVISPRYGVPTYEEFNTQFPTFLMKRRNDIKESIEFQMESLESVLKKKYFEKEINELDLLRKIKKIMKDYFTMISRN